jgi:gamma-glutamylputrescine oxidase
VLEEVRPGVFAVGGYCGTGNVIGSLCGRAAAERALGTVPWLEHLLSG